MYFKNVIVQLLTISIVQSSLNGNETADQCPYDYTVEVESHANDSYTYEDIEIASNLVDVYNYTISKNGTVLDADNHKRACICNLKKCLRVCSHYFGHFYNNITDKSGIDEYFMTNVTLSNGTVDEFHLVKHFHPIPRDVCDGDNFTLMYYNDEWTLFENGTLSHDDHKYLNQSQYCFYIHQNDKELTFSVMVAVCGKATLAWHEYLYGYAMFISLPFFILTILVFCSLHQLRSAIINKCFVYYLSMLALNYSLISFLIINRREQDEIWCSIFGYSIYFTTISYSTWSCLISYDTWKTMDNFGEKSSSFLKYCLVGWSVPSLMTLLTYLAEISSLADELKPDMTEENCGVNIKRWSAVIYIFGPSIIACIFSMTMFVRVLRYIRKTECDSKAYKNDVNTSKNERFSQYIRLFFFMGVSWTIDNVSYFWEMITADSKSISIVLDILTALQGLVIFLMFVCRASVLKIIMDNLRGRRKRDHRPISRTLETEFDK